MHVLCVWQCLWKSHLQKFVISKRRRDRSRKKGEIVKIPLLGSDRTNYGNVGMLLQLCSKDSMAWLSKTAAQKGNRIWLDVWISSLQSELQTRVQKETLNQWKKWIKEQSVTTVHVWRFSWAWASSSRIVGIKCAARRSRHRGCQGHRASSLWLWFLSQDTECSDGSGLCRQGQADYENQR